MATDTGPVYFFGHKKEHGYLSQFYECKFEHEGRSYCNLEQFFQVAKALQAGDEVRKPCDSKTPC